MPSISATYGLRIAPDLRIQQVLVAPEHVGLGAAGARAVVDRDDVAARAEAALAGAVDDDGADVVVVLPLGQRLRDR